MTGLCVLFLFSYIDIRLRKVPVWLLYLTGTVALIYQGMFLEMELWLLLGGTGIGVFFLFVSKITEEGIGYGDSWGILILGMYLGLWELIGILLTGFFLLAVFSGVVFLRKKMPGKSTLPFYPFLTGGYLTVLLIQGGIL